jgi:hypothetical protein
MTAFDFKCRLRFAGLLFPLVAIALGCGDSETPGGSTEELVSTTGNPAGTSPDSAVTGPGSMATSSDAAPSGSAGAEPSGPAAIATGAGPAVPPASATSAAPTGVATAAPTGVATATPTETASAGAGGSALSSGGSPGAGGVAGGAGSSAGSGSLTPGGAGSGAGSGAGGATPSSGPVFHIFMLMGQSNMAGVAKSEASDRNSDERLLVLGGCNQPAGQWNVANPPLSDCPGEKGWNLSDTVDPGIWFGKTLLDSLPAGDTIGLVGTAESGESINTFVSGGSHHQMILNKIEMAKSAENGRFAGVIFHQGESDSGQSTWPGKVAQLYDEVKAAFGVDYDVPFILGELPQGGCCGGHNSLIHQAAEQLPMGYWVSQEGTNVMDEYHFDHPSVVLMGQRYGETMIEALGG